MLFQPFLFQTPPRVEESERIADITPARSTSSRREWVPPIVKTSPAPSKQATSEESFKPSFRTLSARERKICDMRGQLGQRQYIENQPQPRNLSSLGHFVADPDDARTSTPSNPRRTQSPLIPASMPWSTPLSSNAPISITARRRAATDLMATTTPWTTPLPSGNVESDPPNVRRQATDLIPQTMPWVTPFRSSDQKSEDANKYRRRKIIDSVDNEEIVVDPTTKSASSTATTFPFTSLPSSVMSLTESQVRSLVSSKGIHAVSVKFDRDILTGEKRGKMDIVVRYREGSESGVRTQLEDLLMQYPLCHPKGG